jgi:hypothetical protein
MKKAVSKTKAGKVAKTFTGTKVPYFDVIVPPSTLNGDLLYWGIGQTTDVGIFSKLNDDFVGVNRLVGAKHKDEVGEVIRKNGYAYGICVCIYNSKLYPADGNHRLYSLDDNGYPIRFAFRHVDTFEELVSIVIGFNNSAKNWSLNQFVNTYISMDLAPYKLLKEMVTNHGLTNTISAALISDTTVSMVKSDFRAGLLKCFDEDAAKGRVVDIKLFLKKFGIVDQRPAEAIINLIQKIGWPTFKGIRTRLARHSAYLHNEKAFLVGKSKGTPGAKQYLELFTHAYETLPE